MPQVPGEPEVSRRVTVAAQPSGSSSSCLRSCPERRGSSLAPASELSWGSHNMVKNPQQSSPRLRRRAGPGGPSGRLTIWHQKGMTLHPCTAVAPTSTGCQERVCCLRPAAQHSDGKPEGWGSALAAGSLSREGRELQQAVRQLQSGAQEVRARPQGRPGGGRSPPCKRTWPRAAPRGEASPG